MCSVRCFQLVKSLAEAVDDEALALDGGYWHFGCTVSRRDGGRPGDSGGLQETEFCEGDSQRSVSFSEKRG